jgi:hypothetical protein
MRNPGRGHSEGVSDTEPDAIAAPEPGSGTAAGGFLSSSPGRREAESVLVRLVATVGVVAIGTGLGAILVANDVAGWVVGLATSLLTVVLAALLWRSRTL